MNTIDNLLQPLVNKLTHSLMLLFDKPRSFIRYRVYTPITCLCGVVYAAFNAHASGIGLGCLDLIIFCALTYLGCWSDHCKDVSAERKGLANELLSSRWINIMAGAFSLTVVLELALFVKPMPALVKSISILLFWVFDILWIYSAATPPNPPAKVVLQAVRVGAR